MQCSHQILAIKSYKFCFCIANSRNVASACKDFVGVRLFSIKMAGSNGLVNDIHEINVRGATYKTPKNSELHFLQLSARLQDCHLR